MAADIRVLLVKLVDRLQDMFLSTSSIGRRSSRWPGKPWTCMPRWPVVIGIDWLKRELEDLAFKYLYPAEYADLAGRLENSLDERQAYVDEVIAILHEKLAESNITPVRIIGRPKHLYSIYKKLVVQNIPLERVYDKVAFRIIVEHGQRML